MKNASLTKAFNAISSTLKYGAGAFAGVGMRGAREGYTGASTMGLSAFGKNIAGPGKMAGALGAIGGFGMGVGRAMKRGGWRGSLGTGVVGAAGIGAGAAAADFANPWGLGWGD